MSRYGCLSINTKELKNSKRLQTQNFLETSELKRTEFWQGAQKLLGKVTAKVKTDFQKVQQRKWEK